jgi:GT2 family glycosyltransferase
MTNTHLASTPPRVGIGIATKDRWLDLQETLRQLEAGGYHRRHPVVVVDDGSRTPAPAELLERHPWVRFLRHEVNQGYIRRRNEIARLLDTPYVLILDDDAHPVLGSIDDAADYLDASPHVGALACNILCDEATIPGVPLNTRPFRVQRFIGCAHLLRRKLFLYLGGYREELVHYAEEGEYCARLLRHGHEVHYFPAMLFRHNVAHSGRNASRIAYFQGRNRVLLALWHFPWWALPFRLASAFVGSLALVPRACYGSVLSGYLAGLGAGLRYRRNRNPLQRAQYTRWRRLPWISQHHHNPENAAPAGAELLAKSPAA